MSDKATICLWFDSDPGEAVRFYVETFPDSEMGHIETAPADFPGGKAGDTLVAAFTIADMSFIAIGGRTGDRPNASVSFQIHTDSQQETDRLWEAITTNGGSESQCGWCSDRWGYSWQITPRVLTQAMTSPDREAAGRAMQAMMGMKKIDHNAIAAAFEGAAG